MSEQKLYVVYILECSDGSLYTGITNDLESRLQKHREGKGSKYVRTRLPFSLVYTESSSDRSTAQKREWEIKSFSATQKRELIKSYSKINKK